MGEDRQITNTDELIQAMQEDELSDAVKLTPREYARIRSQYVKSAQIVYYHIRQGHLKLERCLCGRSVVDVKLADEYFESRRKEVGTT